MNDCYWGFSICSSSYIDFTVSTTNIQRTSTIFNVYEWLKWRFFCRESIQGMEKSFMYVRIWNSTSVYTLLKGERDQSTVLIWWFRPHGYNLHTYLTIFRSHKTTYFHYVYQLIISNFLFVGVNACAQIDIKHKTYEARDSLLWSVFKVWCLRFCKLFH